MCIEAKVLDVLERLLVKFCSSPRAVTATITPRMIAEKLLQHPPRTRREIGKLVSIEFKVSKIPEELRTETRQEVVYCRNVKYIFRCSELDLVLRHIRRMRMRIHQVCNSDI